MQYGLRTEHVLIYSLFPMAVLVFPIYGLKLVFNKSILFILAILSFIIIETLIVTYNGPRYYYSFAKSIAYFENYFQLFSIIILTTIFVQFKSRNAVISTLLKVIHLFFILLVINSFLTIISVFYDLSSVINYFVAKGQVSISDNPMSVSEMATQMGRYSGVFNQPAESGLSYSLGVILWVYIYSKRAKITLWNSFILISMIIGGILSVSKIFILGGIPLFLIYGIKVKGFWNIFNLKSFIFYIFGWILMSRIFSSWDGLNFLLRLFNIDNKTNILYLFTAGRFGAEETHLKNIMTDVWSISPIYGKGFASELVLDNAYAEFFIQGGVIALVGYLIILLTIFIVSINSPIINKKESHLLFFIFLLIVGGGFGIPVLTANRFSTVCWVIIILLLHVLSYRRCVSKPKPMH